MACEFSFKLGCWQFVSYLCVLLLLQESDASYLSLYCSLCFYYPIDIPFFKCLWLEAIFLDRCILIEHSNSQKFLLFFLYKTLPNDINASLVIFFTYLVIFIQFSFYLFLIQYCTPILNDLIFLPLCMLISFLFHCNFLKMSSRALLVYKCWWFFCWWWTLFNFYYPLAYS